MSGARRRLDVELVRRGLAASRQDARIAIEGGRVLVGGALAERASRLVSPGEPVELLGPPRRFVGRGGEKLDAALSRFDVDVAGAVALDAGASTGGFTDCLLRRGAALVAAVDVGHGQLDPRLRADRRVVVLERTNVRTLAPASLAESLGPGRVPVDVVTADLSFISLTAAVPVLAGGLLRPGGSLVLLVKPQFEVGRAEASRGRGVIREPELWLSSLRAVASSLAAAGAAIMDAMQSPITGASGNTEFFVHAVAHAAPEGAALDDASGRALREALPTAPR
ncbi:MAG TPA: TlyA family RNA methyltransferase [Acidimicrobiales bacterium]|nr:TlyA family RNA methyltransferase [Acidimicrobiales bacterium]